MLNANKFWMQNVVCWECQNQCTYFLSKSQHFCWPMRWIVTPKLEIQKLKNLKVSNALVYLTRLVWIVWHANRVQLAVLHMAICHSVILWLLAILTLYWDLALCLMYLQLVSCSVAHREMHMWPMVWRPEVLDTQCQFTRLSSPVVQYRLLGQLNEWKWTKLKK